MTRNGLIIVQVIFPQVNQQFRVNTSDENRAFTCPQTTLALYSIYKAKR